MSEEPTSTIQVTVNLDASLWAAVETATAGEDITTSDLLSAALTRHLRVLGSPAEAGDYSLHVAGPRTGDLAEVDPDFDLTGCA